MYLFFRVANPFNNDATNLIGHFCTSTWGSMCMVISIVTLQQEGPDIWPGPFCVKFRCLQGSLWVLWLLPVVQLLGLGGSKYAMGVYVTVSVFLHVLAVTDWRSVVAGMSSTPLRLGYAEEDGWIQLPDITDIKR